MKNQLPTAPAERLALGKRLHDKIEWATMKEAESALGIAQHRLFVVLKEFRDSEGIVTETMRSASKARQHGRPKLAGETPEEAAERKRAIKKRSYDKRKAERAAEKAAGSYLPPVPVAAAPSPALAVLEARNRELEDQLERAMDEVHTLQKLLMVVGKAL